MIPFRKIRKQSKFSFKVIVVCLLLSGSLISPGFARANCYTTNIDGTVLINGDECTESALPPGGSLVIDNTVTSIGNSAFYRNTALTSVIIGNSVTSIGNSAFSDNFALTSVTIPDSVISIGDEAFINNTALTSVTIGNSVESIGEVAFGNTPALRNITIPNSVKTIGLSAFEGSGLTSVTIGNHVDLIGPFAFFQTQLTSVTIPASVTSIGESAFDGAVFLRSVIFLGYAPDPVYTAAFSNIADLAKAYVLGFASGFGLENALWNGLVVSYDAPPVDGPCYVVVETVLTDGSTCTGPLVIDNTVTSIDTDAFNGNTDLTSVTIGNSVTSIGAGAFWGADGITLLTIGNSVTAIGNTAFNGVNKIITLVIPDSVITIGNSAFSGTGGLTSLTLGNHLTTIGTGAFGGSHITSLVIPNSVLSIGPDAFQAISTLTSVTFGNSVTSIGDRAFFFDTALTSVTFLGIAAPAVAPGAFLGVPEGATANVLYNATGFGANGSTWNDLIVTYGSAPVGDSGSSSSNVVIITPTVVKTADASIKLTNRKYLSKFEIRKAISKGRSFKRKPIDFYKYSISKTSKKSCVMSGNYVRALKDTGACEIWVTRTTAKGAKYKYWVKINYIS